MKEKISKRKAWFFLIIMISALIFIPLVGILNFPLFFPFSVYILITAYFPNFKQSKYLIPILYSIILFQAYYSLETEDYPLVLDWLIEINSFLPCLFGYADTVLLKC